MPTGSVALKEWAVIVQALAKGQHMLLLRKGGIAEETKEFHLESRSFYLYPTFEHQKQACLKTEYQPELAAVLADSRPESGQVEISCRAEAVEDVEIRSTEELERLAPFAIWTASFAEERLKWKRQSPLHLLLLRVYRLEEPVQLKVLPAYGGCKSWVRLEAELAGRKETPVMDNQTFERQRAEVKKALG